MEHPTANSYGALHSKQLHGAPTANSYGAPHSKQLWSTPQQTAMEHPTANSYGAPHSKQLWSTPQQTATCIEWTLWHTATEYPTADRPYDR